MWSVQDLFNMRNSGDSECPSKKKSKIKLAIIINIFLIVSADYYYCLESKGIYRCTAQFEWNLDIDIYFIDVFGRTRINV